MQIFKSTGVCAPNSRVVQGQLYITQHMESIEMQQQKRSHLQQQPKE